MFVLAALLAWVLTPLQDPSPTAIVGRVVDEQHQPVEGVWLLCESTLTSDDAADISARDGSFELRTRFTGPHLIRIDARGLEPRDMPHVEAGTRNLEIVLPARAFQTFRVLDDASGKPLELVEIETMAAGSIDWGPITSEPARDYREAPGGVRRVCVPAGERVWFSVYAPGHAPCGGDVRQGLADGVPQEVRLRAGAQLHFKVTGPSGPIQGANIRLEQSHARGASAADRGPIEPEVRIRRTDAGGVFHTGELFGGEYTLRVEAAGLTRFERHFLEIAPGEARDLGTLEMRPGASLAGRVIVPAGVDPSSVRMTCVLHESRVPVAIARDGTFRLCSLDAGRFALDVPAGQACAVMLWHFEWELAPEEPRWVDLDLAAHWPRDLHVIVLDHGRPLEGARVLSRGHELRLSREIATTGADGTASGRIEPGRGARIVLANALGIELGEHFLDPELAPGAAVEQRFELSTGTAGLELPAGYSAPTNARSRLELQFRVTDQPAAPTFSVDVSLDGNSPGVRIEAGRIDLGRMSEGNYEIALCRIACGGEFGPETKGLRCSGRLRVKAGEATVARLEFEP